MAETAFAFQWGEPRPQAARQLPRDRPLRVAILGDFTGRGSRGLHAASELPQRTLTSVDLDNFEELLARWAPTVHVGLGDAAGVAVTVRSLEDFHADALYDQLEVFASLRASRRRLQDPAKFAEEAERLGALAVPPPPTPPPVTPVAPVSEADLLNQMLGLPPAPADTSRPIPPVKVAGIDLAKLVAEVVAPYVLPAADPRQADYLAAVDAAAAETLRRVLHARAFQRLEAAWKQLWRVTKALTGEGQVRLFLLDVTRDELASDLGGVGDKIRSASLCRLLVDQVAESVDGAPWSALVSLETFGRSEADCALLASLGAVAKLAGGVLLADGSPEIVGCTSWPAAVNSDTWRLGPPSDENRWTALRQSEVAATLALAAPRPLVRLPYGRNSPTSRLTFAELGKEPAHEQFLWGSAGLAVLELVGLTFLSQGSGMRLGSVADLEDLPPCVIDHDGDKQLLPCAETFLSTTTGDLLADRGLMPLLSHRQQHAVRIARFRSLSISQPQLRIG